MVEHCTAAASASDMNVCLLPQLATLAEHPESVPINALVAVAGTPLEVCAPPSAMSEGHVLAQLPLHA